MVKRWPWQGTPKKISRSSEYFSGVQNSYLTSINWKINSKKSGLVARKLYFLERKKDIKQALSWGVWMVSGGVWVVSGWCLRVSGRCLGCMDVIWIENNWTRVIIWICFLFSQWPPGAEKEQNDHFTLFTVPGVFFGPRWLIFVPNGQFWSTTKC